MTLELTMQENRKKTFGFVHGALDIDLLCIIGISK